MSAKKPRCIYSGEIEELHDGDSVAIGGELQLVYNSYLNIDFTSCDTQSIILIGDTLINFSNFINGKHCRLIIIQDDAGSRKVLFTNSLKWPQGILPILSILPNSIDIFTFIKSRDIIYGDYLKNF